MEPNEEDIAYTRQKALDKLELEPGVAHPKDVDRLRNDKNWIRRFLLHHEMDKEKAVNMICGSIKWRQKFGANDISHSNVNLQVLSSGGMFPHGRDKDGKLMFIIKVKLNVKGIVKSEDVHKALVYWLDRLEKQEKGDKISIFFEMTGAGLSNLDMEFVQYLIMLFRDYYPYFLNYIIVFEMSWILNAAWKVVKSWMPGRSVEMVKFLGRSDLKTFVPVDQQLVEWGGTVNYQFVFEPEFLPATWSAVTNGQHSDEARKKVHFAEDTTSDSGSVGSTENALKKLIPGQLLQLTPAEEIIFRREDGETTGVLTITNAGDCNVAYKIKTTSPDKYRVRPSAGLIASAGGLSVTVHIQSGYSASQLVRDKFLVMACAVEGDSLSPQQLAEVWKKTADGSIQQHRLRCSVAPSDASDDFSGDKSQATSLKLLQEFSVRMEGFMGQQENLLKQLKFIRLLLIILLFVTFALPFYLFPDFSSSDHGCRVSPSSS